MSAMLLHFAKPKHVTDDDYTLLKVKNANILGLPLSEDIIKKAKSIVIRKVYKY